MIGRHTTRGTLLKLYIYGYLDRVQSNRRQEREAQRNVELMWLAGKRAPDPKTIVNFRRNNGEAIRAARAHFIVLCRQIGLFTRAVAAVDGSKFMAVNTRHKNFTAAKLKKSGSSKWPSTSPALRRSWTPATPWRARLSKPALRSCRTRSPRCGRRYRR